MSESDKNDFMFVLSFQGSVVDVILWMDREEFNDKSFSGEVCPL